MKVEVKVPEAGESITEGVLVEWYKADGDTVEAEEPLFDLETDKITMTVQAEVGGRITLRVEEGATVQIGQIVAVIDTEAAAAAGDTEAAAAAGGDGPPISTPAGMPQAQEKIAAATRPEDLSPAVRRLVTEENVDPAGVAASGKDGRLTKGDVLAHLAAPTTVDTATPTPRPEQTAKPEPKPTPKPEKAAPAPPAPAQAPSGDQSPEARQTRRPMSRLRQRIAERLVGAQQTAAILTTFNEIDMTNVMALRKRHKEAFEKRHGARLGFMSFFVKAVVDALRAVPALNAQIEGDEIVYNHFYDIGVAVGTDAGLVVPVIRDADKLGFAGVESAIGAVARKARDRKLTLADLTGGVFTISNGGVYGSLLSTPILNPPQSGILGLHAIKRRPMAVPDGNGGEKIEIRPMMYVAMSYDHRLVDGKEAVTFLKRIVECMENPERMMLEV